MPSLVSYSTENVSTMCGDKSNLKQHLVNTAAHTHIFSLGEVLKDEP